MHLTAIACAEGNPKRGLDKSEKFRGAAVRATPQYRCRSRRVQEDAAKVILNDVPKWIVKDRSGVKHSQFSEDR